MAGSSSNPSPCLKSPRMKLSPLARFARILRRRAYSNVTRNSERPVLLAVVDAAKKAARPVRKRK